MSGGPASGRPASGRPASGEATLADVTWPRAQAAEALRALAVHAGLRMADTVELGGDGPGDAARARWLPAAADALGLEAQVSSVAWGEVDALLARGGPALLELPDGGLIALLDGRRGRVRVCAPSSSSRVLPASLLADALRGPLEARVGPDADSLLAEAGLPADRRAKARRALIAERLRGFPATTAWLLRPGPGAPLGALLRAAGLAPLLAALVAAHLAQAALWMGSWVVLGRGVLDGRLDTGWLVAWALLLAARVPLGMAVAWYGGRVALACGGTLKTRLLAGALRLDPEEVRHAGVGVFLGQVAESEAVEQLALNGGVSALMALVNLVLCAGMLAGGAAGGALVALLVVATGGATVLAVRYHDARRAWTDRRRALTAALVERMVGHRTRLAQEPPARWHVEEDASLADYADRSIALDRAAAWLAAGVPRLWLVAAIGVLATAFVPGAPAAELALSVGGVLLAWRALADLSGGAAALAGAAIAWRGVAHLQAAASRPVARGVVADDRPRSGALLDATNLAYTYPGRARPVFDGASFRIHRGDRILLEGASGSGKSTLGSLLVGLRQPTAGLLRLGGLDHAVLGDAGWRRHTVTAPQFHENRVLLGTFAFNALVGRGWPPSPEDLADLEALCEALGLAPLLGRMPGGVHQVVGESGWQLSHGERSRLFLARALLQGAELVVLDECFGALDPATLDQALRCTLARAPTLVVIAHP